MIRLMIWRWLHRGYQHFLEQDFGWEDKFYLVGVSKPDLNWSYILPGPKDGWGGTGGTSGLRTHNANILFGLQNKTCSRWLEVCG